MGSAAQLQRVVLDADRPDALAVLLVEERVGAGGDGLRHRQNGCGHGPVLAHDAADLVLDRHLLVRGQGPIQRVVEPQVVRGHERAGLMGVRPDDVSQRPVQQMGGRVVAHRPGSPFGVDARRNRLAHLESAVELAAMDEEPGDRLLRVLDREQVAAAAGFEDLAVVADLAAALAVEGRGVEDHFGLALAGQLLILHAVTKNRDDASFRLDAVVAEELRLADAALDALVQVPELGVAGQIRLGALAAAGLLLGHGGGEAVAIDANAVLGRHIHGQIHGEAVGVVEPEGNFAGENRRVGRERLGPPADDALLHPERRQRHFEMARARLERAGELSLFLADDLEDPARAARPGTDTRPSSRR